MLKEHEVEFKVTETIGPPAMLTWALCVLADVMEASMPKQERNSHIEDAREAITRALVILNQ